MNFMSFYVVLCFFVCCVFICGIVLGYKNNTNDVNSSPFECGFDSSGVVRLPFCINFFLVGIIFLVFDVEISLLFPVYYSSVSLAPLLSVLLGGLYYEWGYGGLQWMV